MRTNAWLAVPALFVAVKVSGYVPPVPLAGVPDSVAVPADGASKVMPVGSDPAIVMVGAGEPDDVTVKLNACPV